MWTGQFKKEFTEEEVTLRKKERMLKWQKTKKGREYFKLKQQRFRLRRKENDISFPKQENQND